MSNTDFHLLLHMQLITYPYLEKFKATVQILFLFYQNSSVRMAGLYAIQEVLADLVIKLKTSYGEPAAVGLVKFVKTYYFVDCC